MGYMNLLEYCKRVDITLAFHKFLYKNAREYVNESSYIYTFPSSTDGIRTSPLKLHNFIPHHLGHLIFQPSVLIIFTLIIATGFGGFKTFLQLNAENSLLGLYLSFAM